jgi:hypothetical protein
MIFSLLGLVMEECPQKARFWCENGSRREVHGVMSWCCNHCKRILLKYAAGANYESHMTGTQSYKLWMGRFRSHRDVREHLLAEHHLVDPDGMLWSKNEELWSLGHHAITNGEDVWG